MDMKRKLPIFNTAPLIILGGGVHQIPYILFCKKNKIPTLVIDQDKKCLAKTYADYMLNIKTPNSKSLNVFNKIKKITKKTGVKGVLVAGVELAVLGSFLAKKFKTKGIDPFTAIVATNKIKRSIELKKKKIPISEFKVFKKIETIKNKFPFVIKTEYGSGSRGVCIVLSKTDLIFVKNQFSKVKSSKFIVEDFLTGYEISIEAFIYKKKFYYYCFAIRDIEILSKGKIIEHGSISDPLHDKQSIDKVKKIFEKGCFAIGLKEGPAKGDILFTKLGPKIIEIAARSAPLAPLISKKVYNFDMISAHIRWSMGLNPFLNSKPIDYFKTKPVCHKYLSHKKGTLCKVNGIEKIKKLKNVIKVIVLRDLKYPMKLDEPNNTNRLLYVVTTGSNANNARSNAVKSLSKIQLLYKQS